MEELWKPITCLKHSEGMLAHYEASNLGNIRNKKTRRSVKPHWHNTGYQIFNYRYKDECGNWHAASMLWHRVIAITWLENPDNLPQVDHINRNMIDNRVENLRWASAKENSNNTSEKSHIRYSRFAPTQAIDRDGNVIAEYPTLLEACEAYHVRLAHALEMLHGRRRQKKWGTFRQETIDKLK